MNGPDSISPDRQPKLINASQLVGLLGQAGPISDIQVRIHFRDGSIKSGVVKWSDDRAGSGPVVVIPNKEDPYNEQLIPLGGQTVYMQPPRISSLSSARTTPILFGESSAQKMPIRPDTANILFEVISEK